MYLGGDCSDREYRRADIIPSAIRVRLSFFSAQIDATEEERNDSTLLKLQPLFCERMMASNACVFVLTDNERDFATYVSAHYSLKSKVTIEVSVYVCFLRVRLLNFYIDRYAHIVMLVASGHPNVVIVHNYENTLTVFDNESVYRNSLGADRWCKS